MPAYYNEFDPYAAQWLRNLIAAGHIAPGDVDERSIVDVQPSDLVGYEQCHFFAGLGGWSLAARLCGWPDRRPLWTGSCPCQPFSVAGKGKGEEDERHLWPEFLRLIRSRRPPVVMGEQVAAAVGKNWLDGVFSDLEGIAYTGRAAVVPACAVDAPHRRDRLWFVADANGARIRVEQGRVGGASGASSRLDSDDRQVFMADADGLARGQGGSERRGGDTGRDALPRPGSCGDGGVCTLADTNLPRPERQSALSGTPEGASEGLASRRGRSRAQPMGHAGGEGLAVGSESEDQRGDVRDEGEAALAPGPRSFWTGSEILVGADGKARRVKPGIRLLAHGVPSRVGRLRAYGNAIVPQVAAEIIGAYLDELSELAP